MLTGNICSLSILFAGSRKGRVPSNSVLIAPFLILLFMVSIELPRAYTIGKRLDNATATMGDLISRGNYKDLSLFLPRWAQS